MICECGLKRFVKMFPEYRQALSSMLPDPDYVVKYMIDEHGQLEYFEIGYSTDLFAIDCCNLI